MRLRLFLLLSFVMTVMGLSAQSLVFHYCGGGEATVALPATWSLSDGKIVVSNGSSTIEINKNEILTVSYRGKQGDVNGDERVDIGDVATILGLIANSSEGGNNTSDGTPIGSGTAADPWNVAGVLAASNDLASMALLNDGADVYVKGVVTELVEISPEYGNATYYISDDTDAINKLYVYRGKLLDGAPVTSVTDLKVGDEVTVCGKIKNYGGTIEFDKENYLVTHKKGEGGGSSEPPVSPGTVDKPLTVAEALAYIAGLDADKQSPEGYVKGKIVSVGELDTGPYGNATYTISDDGTDTTTLLIYRGYSLGGIKFQSANEIKAGDEVIVKGKLLNFKGNTPQVAQGSSIYSLNGKTSGGETGGQGGVMEGNTLTVVYGDLGITSLDDPIKLVDGTTLTFSQEDGKTRPIYHESTKIVRMYAHNSMTVNAGSKKIAQVVFNYDTYSGTAYCGNPELYGQAGSNKLTPAIDDKTVTFTDVNASTLKVVNDFETNSGGMQFRCTGLVITFAE